MTTVPQRPPSAGQPIRTGRPTVPASRVPPPLPAAPSSEPVQRFAPALAIARRVAKIAIYTLVPLIMLSGIAISIAYVRLRHGPVAFDYLVPPIERGINTELASNTVKIASAEFRLSEDGGFEFRLRDISVSETDGDVVMSAPLAAVTLSTAALWRLRIVPERIDLIDPEIRLSYSDDSGLALVSDATAKPVARPAAEASPGAAEVVITKTKSASRAFSVTRLLSDASHRARQKLDATSYLTEFGLRNATVALEYAGQKSAWKVPEVNVDFDHGKKRSVISGRVTVASARGPWSISFLTDEGERSGRLTVKSTVRDLWPSTLAAAAPPLAMLRMLELPVAGDATLELSSAGDIEKANIGLEIGAGSIAIPDLTAEPLNLTAGLFRLTYDGVARRWSLEPSPIKWADGNISFTGTATDESGGSGPPVWRYKVDGRDGVFEASEFKVPPLKLDTWSMAGAITPRRGLFEVDEFKIAGGGGGATMRGLTQAGPNGQSSRTEFTLSAMPLQTLKAMWPRTLAPGAREWIGKRVTAASFKGGTVRYHSGEFLAGEAPMLGDTGARLSATAVVEDSTVQALDGMAPITAPRTLIRLENNALEISVPDGAAQLSGNRRLPVKTGLLTSANVLDPRPEAQLSFAVQGALAPFLEVIETLPLNAVREAAPFPKAAEGKVDAQLKINIPLVSDVDADSLTFEGKAKISDGRFPKAGGTYEVQGFTLGLDVTEKAVDAKGDLLVNGVPAKISAQRVFGVGGSEQPPITISAKLDEADRTQLGIDVNNIVRGVLPVEISMQPNGAAPPVIKLRADLTPVELTFEGLGWNKAAGRSALLETDIATGKIHKTELQNFRVTGDNIAVDGWLAIGADNRLREFKLPQVSLNVISRLELQGALGNDNIWQVKARGPTFDGRDLFRSFFTVGDRGGKSQKPGKQSGGMDLAVDVDNVLGHSDLALKGLKLKLSTRAEKLASLDARATVEGTAVALALDKSSSSRRLVVDGADAGRIMRLIDFYPNMQDGRLRLEVELDGKGAAETTGILWVEKFRVLGDPVVSEVVGSADQGRPGISNGRRVTRETFEFDRLKAPFSIGYGQFVLEDAYLKGPLVGANLRGKVDFKTRRVNLGGTYIPLQGLNNALGGIPLLGQLISGPRGDGIFGITFAIQGAMAEPQVIVNPLSLVAPGIFREMFQMTTADPQVQVREDRPASKPNEGRPRQPPVRAPEVGGEPVRAREQKSRSANDDVDGWSSTTQN